MKIVTTHECPPVPDRIWLLIEYHGPKHGTGSRDFLTDKEQAVDRATEAHTEGLPFRLYEIEFRDERQSAGIVSDITDDAMAERHDWLLSQGREGLFDEKAA